jgi:SAM-dependent methyltransferase
MKCRLCGSEAITRLYDSAPDYVTDAFFQVYQCENCTFAFTSPVPDDLSPHYPTRYRQYHPLIINTLSLLYRQRVKKWNRLFARPGAAFEMGYGDGIMLDNLRRLGWKVFGSERTVEAAHFARHALDMPVFVGGPPAIKPAPVFDLVFLFQVLEHLDNPVDTIRQIGQFLTPNGKLIIGVPNFSGWQRRFSGKKWFHLDVPRHLSHFSAQSLDTLVKTAGLEIERVGFVSFEHDPYGWVQSLLNMLDSQPNRLTRLLMGVDPMGFKNFAQVIFAVPLGVVGMILAILSWMFKSGAVIEVIVRKPAQQGSAGH